MCKDSRGGTKGSGLAQENVFWLSIIIVHVAVAGKGAASLCTCRKECNKYDI
jgi:hypothetical protein